MIIEALVAHHAVEIGVSAGFVALVLAARAHLSRRVAPRGTVLNVDQRARLFRVRLAAGLFLALGLGAIWFAELQSLLWSLTAVMVALVVATKELIQCGTGSVMRAAGRSFSIGDRIEIDGIYGEIVGHGLLTTTIAERERGSAGRRLTGRRIVLPNSRLFASEVRIESLGAAFVTHRFHVIFDPLVSTQAAVTFVEAEMRRLCEPFAEALEAASLELACRSGMSQPATTPIVTLATTEMAKIRLEIVFSSLGDSAAAIEREMKMEFLEWLWAHAQARQAKVLAERYAPSNDGWNRAA